MNQVAMLWLIAAVVFGVVEIITAPLICIWFCGGALVAALIGGITNSMWVSTVAFVVVSGILLAFTRPLVKSKIAPKVQPTNADRIIGKEAVVVLGIDPVENVGQIKVDGQV
ncbi:MAG: NfeD family protein, partial [Clostridia bacterium]|nr:NfeD family protein [Clostridia bacterium]